MSYDFNSGPEQEGGSPSPSPAAGLATLDKRLVHKCYDENVLLSQVERMPGKAEAGEGADQPAREDHFRGTLYVQRAHRFFFEHAREHVPGLYLIEAGRQMSVAVAHMFYGVPFGVEFIMTELNVDFRNMANIHDPLIAYNTMSRHVFRKGQLSSMYSAGVIRQGELDVARMSGTMVMMDKGLMKRLERRGARV